MNPRLIAALVLLFAAPVSASVPDLFGYGARALGLAGAVATAPEGAAAVYYGPAALAFETRPSVALGFQRADFLLSLDGTDYAVEPATATTIGLVLPLGFGGILAERLVLGCGFVIPTDAVLVATLPAAPTPRFSLVESRAQTVTLQAALGLRLHPRLAVGAGIIALSALDGAIDVAPNQEGRIGSTARSQLVASYATVLSALIQWPGDVASSVTYRGESAARFSLPLQADLGERFPLPLPELVVRGVAQYDPAQLDGELSAEPVAGLRVALGATWKAWSAYPIPLVYPAVPEAFPPQPPPNFVDTVELRVGGEGTWGRFTPRLGYRLIPSPAPEQTGPRNDLDNVRHLLAAGLGLRWAEVHVDLGVQWHHLVARAHVKSAASIEAAGFPADDHPGSPGIEHGGDVFVVGLEVGAAL